MNYEVKHKGPKWGGLDWYQCPYCTRESPSQAQMDIHVEMMHTDKFQITLTRKELIEMARLNKVSVWGTKKQIAERIREKGIAYDTII